MTLPDLLLSVAGVGLLFSVLPGIVENFRDRKARNFTMSVLIASMLVLVVVAYVMLGTVFAAAITGVQAGMWVVLAVQAKVWGDK